MKPEFAFLHDIDPWVTRQDLNLLFNSMRQLTEFADRISPPDSLKRKSTLAQAAKGEVAAGHHQPLILKPKFDWQVTDNQFMLVAVTPGLAKEDLSVEIVEQGGARFLEITGETTKTPAPQEKDTAPPPMQYASYFKFERKIQLPEDIDVGTLIAKYEDGMLKVTMHRANADKGPVRQKITIA